MIKREKQRRGKERTIKKEELNKARIKSLVDNEKWDATIQARAVGGSTSMPLRTDRLAVPEQIEDPDGDIAEGSGTHDPRD